jgi:hypothetical protein
MDLTGIFPISIIIDDKVIHRLQAKKVPGISNFDPELLVCWFIPRAMEIKKTKNGKDYLILSVIDDSGKVIKIKGWSYDPNRDIISINHPYVAKLDYSDQWGFSARSISKSFKMIG